MTFRIGERQRSGLEIYVLDPVFAVLLFEDDALFPGRMDAEGLHVDDCELAWRLITDGANRADDQGDRELCEALSSLGSRVLRRAE